MILLVDIGNTRLKWAYLENNIFSFGGASRYDDKSLENILATIWKELPLLQQVYIASVAKKKIADNVQDWIKHNYSVTCQFLSSQNNFEKLHNAYRHPQQLGIDRWMSLVACYRNYQKPFAVFNCGTAVTVDAVDTHGKHIGGLIIPGLELMQQTLVKKTAGCKMQSKLANKTDSLLAGNTHQAISGGSLYAIAAFIQKLTEELQHELGQNLTCLISGGDARAVFPLLSEKFIYEENLVLRGVEVMARLPTNC